MKQSYRITLLIVLFLSLYLYGKPVASSGTEDISGALSIAQVETVIGKDTLFEGEAAHAPNTNMTSKGHTIIIFSLFVVILLIVIVAVVLILILHRLRNLSRE